jgi:hypothetical protein
MYARAVLVSLALGQAAAIGQYQTPAATPTWTDVVVVGCKKTACVKPMNSSETGKDFIFGTRGVAKEACARDETCPGVAKAEKYDELANWRVCEKVVCAFKGTDKTAKGAGLAQMWESLTWTDVEVTGGQKRACINPTSPFKTRLEAQKACEDDPTCAGVAKAEEYDAVNNWRTCEKVDEVSESCASDIAFMGTDKPKIAEEGAQSVTWD